MEKLESLDCFAAPDILIKHWLQASDQATDQATDYAADQATDQATVCFLWQN